MRLRLIAAVAVVAAVASRPEARGADSSAVRDYVVFDVLFLDRDNASNNQAILLDGQSGASPGGTIFTTRSLVPTTGPGGRRWTRAWASCRA